MSEATFMRIIVFFDLPVKTRLQRKIANQFRQFLLKDGYQMLQLSVYTRIVRGRDSLEKHNKRLTAHLPEEGAVRCLEITEKQFTSMLLLVGELKPQEEKINANQLLLFFNNINYKKIFYATQNFLFDCRYFVHTNKLNQQFPTKNRKNKRSVFKKILQNLAKNFQK